MEKISVVMAVYNEPFRMIEEAMDSIFNQTYKNIELIVVLDNPNNKELYSFLLQYGNKIKLVVNKENKGLPYSLNVGIAAASGNIIARMDSDDISFPNRLEVEYKFLIEGSYDLISSNITYIDEDGKELNIIHNAPDTDKKLLRRLKHVNCMSHPTYMFTKKMYDITGGYKEELKAAQDYEFVNNAIERGFHIGICTETLLKYRIRNGNISQTKSVLQRFVTYYVRDAYIYKKGYSKRYIVDCLSGNNKEFIKFSEQYSIYQNETKGLSGLKKKIKQAELAVRMKFIRNILYHDFIYQLLIIFNW